MLALGKDVGHWHDPTLDHLVARDPFEPAARDWSIVELAEPFPEARAAPRAYTAASLGDLLSRFTREDDLDMAWFLSEDDVPGRPEGKSARVVSWDGTNATVEHDGPCDLVIARSFDPGWTARINGVAPPSVCCTWTGDTRVCGSPEAASTGLSSSIARRAGSGT